MPKITSENSYFNGLKAGRREALGYINKCVEVLEQFVFLTDDPIFEDDNNGPGIWRCEVCGAYVNAKWDKSRYDPTRSVPTMPNPIIHSDKCPLENAKQIILLHKAEP